MSEEKNIFQIFEMLDIIILEFVPSVECVIFRNFLNKFNVGIIPEKKRK